MTSRIDADIRGRYPYPLAATFHRAYYESRDLALIHDYLLDLFEVTLKYCAAVALAQYQADGQPDPAIDASLGNLRRPSLGHWQGWLRDILRLYGRAQRPLVVPELAAFYDQKHTTAILAVHSGLRDLMAAQMDYRGDDKQVASVTTQQFFELLGAYRNRLAHGARLNVYDREQVARLLMPALRELLLRLAFLADYRLIYINTVQLASGADRRSTQYVYDYTELSGTLPGVAQEPAVLPTPAARPDELVLLAREGDFTPVLSLHPFLIYHHCDQCSAEQVFMVNPSRPDALTYLSYQCSHQISVPAFLGDVQAILARAGVVGSAEPAPAESAPLEAPPPPSNLPVQLTPLVGRAQETAAACALLRQAGPGGAVRLLTFTGPAGTGKTRLAIQVATVLAADFAAGVSFVPLAPLTDPALVALTIAQGLQVKEGASRPVLEGLKEALRDKQLLLVLDNFEHLTAAAPLVTELLRAAPGLKILVTSRTALHLTGEHEFPVPPLALPPVDHLPAPAQLAQYAALELFVERAQAVKPDFALTPDNAAAVAQICLRLDGLPLAIELAAARVKILTPAAMLARLENRLTLLTGGARDLPARQQTLRGAITWSYDLLDEAEQRLFARLAVFVGGWSLEAAEAVAGDEDEGTRYEVRGTNQNTASSIPHTSYLIPRTFVLDGLASLVDKSLVRQDELHGEPRFALLQTIREYGLERLEASGEATLLRQRHAGFFLALAEAAAPELQGAEQATWLERLETDYANLRAALDWSLYHAQPETALRLAVALWRFWRGRGYWTEGRRWLDAVLAQPEGAAALRLLALLGAGDLAWMQGDAVPARALLDQGLALAWQVGDRRSIARALRDLAALAISQHDIGRGTVLGEVSLELFRELGDKTGLAEMLPRLGLLARDQGDYPRANSLFAESLALARELHNNYAMAKALFNQGLVAWLQEDYALATALQTEALDLFRALGFKVNVGHVLEGLGRIALMQGDTAQAQARGAEALALFRDLDQREGIAEALDLLGLVALQRGDAPAATACYRESLAAWQEIGDEEALAVSLAGAAGVAMGRGLAAPAARLAGACAAQHAVLGVEPDPAIRALQARTEAAARAALGDDAFAEHWAEGQALSLDEAIAEVQTILA